MARRQALVLLVVTCGLAARSRARSAIGAPGGAIDAALPKLPLPAAAGNRRSRQLHRGPGWPRARSWFAVQVTGKRADLQNGQSGWPRLEKRNPGSGGWGRARRRACAADRSYDDASRLDARVHDGPGHAQLHEASGKPIHRSVSRGQWGRIGTRPGSRRRSSVYPLMCEGFRVRQEITASI